jgi:hypothetical protein
LALAPKAEFSGKAPQFLRHLRDATEQGTEKGWFSNKRPEKHTSGAKQAAEKGAFPSKKPERHPSGDEAHVYFQLLTARLKSCPFAQLRASRAGASFSAACKAPFHFAGLFGTTEVVP